MTEFDNLVVIDSKEAVKTPDLKTRQGCKVIKFTSKLSLNDIKSCIAKLKAKLYPNLFIFVIETDDYDAFVDNANNQSKEVAIIYDHVKQFCVNRPLILQIVLNKGTSTKFFHKPFNSEELIDIKFSNDFEDFQDLRAFLDCYRKGRIEGYQEKIVEKLPNVGDSATVLRFLKSLDLPYDFFYNLLLKCAAKGSKEDFLAIIDASFQDKGRILNLEAQEVISETNNFEEILMSSLSEFIGNPSDTSILQIAVEHKNQQVIDYLITNCTHLIQQLPFDHRILISTTVCNQKEYGTLCRLIKSSDFPFPNNFQEHSITDEELRKVVLERNEFHEAIASSANEKLSIFIEKNSNLKIVFNTTNRSALATAVEFKNFKGLVQLKSMGFMLENGENMNSLSKEEKRQFEKTKWQQTIKNADEARPDAKKSAMLLTTRSLIHNRMTSKKLEEDYRQQIRKWFDDLGNIPLCLLLLDAASQCEELKIIFDFESDSVENVDLKNPLSLGTTYTGRKWIFIGAKGTNKLRKQEIKGVLIHEICHYVMRLVYENSENPFFAGDKENAKMFLSVVKEVKKMLSEIMLENPSADECEGIISSVYADYNEKDHPQELFVRPCQILALYDDDEAKVEVLRTKYQSLFVYHDFIIRGDVRNFCLRNRQNVRKINQITNLVSEIGNMQHKFSNPKNIKNLLGDKCTILTTNAPKLLLLSIYIYIQKENLPDTKNVFITPKVLQNTENFNMILQIPDLEIIVDCSSPDFQGLEGNLKDIIANSSSRFIFIVPNGKHSEERLKVLTKEMIFLKRDINFNFSDLAIETQIDLLQLEVEFQSDSKILLSDLISTESIGNKGSPQLYISINEDNILNIIDENLLNMLVEKSKITINAHIQDEKFKILFQPRQFIKGCTFLEDNSSENIEPIIKISQDELLLEVCNMKLILISDFAGTGKTWTLKNIMRALLDQTPLKWITFVDLKQTLQPFKTQSEEIEFSSFMINNVLKCEHNFEEKIFANLYKNGKVHILLDGFDEIVPDHVDFAIDLIKSFKSNGGNKLWISTRENLEATLKENLKFDAVYKLDEFSEEDGAKLITLIWALKDLKGKINLQGDVKELVEMHSREEKYQVRVQKWLEVISKMQNRSIGLPQFHKIIAAFEDNKGPNQKELLNTYKIFLKFMQYQCKKAQNQEEIELDAMKVHHYFAIKSLFTDENKFCELVPYHLDNADDKLLLCGLMLKNNGNFLFRHQSFREFYIADFILRYPLTNMKNKKGIEILVNFFLMILTTCKFEVVRMFLNDGLSDEKIKKAFEQVIKEHAIIFERKMDEIFTIIFKEGLENISELLLTIFGEENYEKVKTAFQATIQNTIKASINSESFKKYQGIIIHFLNEDDLKQFIRRHEVFQRIVCSKLDPDVLKDLAEKLESKIDTNFVRDMLSIPQTRGKRNIFHLLCIRGGFNRHLFQGYFDKIKSFLRNSEILKLIKEVDETGRNVMHTCVHIKNHEMLDFMWQNIKDLFPQDQSFKEFIMERCTQNNSTILHLAAHCSNISFHQVLWKLLLETITNKDKLLSFILQNYNDGANFLHLLVKGRSNVMDYTLAKLKVKLNEKQFMQILNSKDNMGRNMLQIAAFMSTDVEMQQKLWDCYKPYEEFSKILEATDNEGNNILHIAACHSTERILNFMIKELEASKETIINLLNSKNNDQQNILQLAALNNKSQDLHKYLWSLVHVYFEAKDILIMINSENMSGYNVLSCAVSSNTKDVSELTWNKIKSFINNEEDQKKYLTKCEEGGKSAYKISIENVENPEVFLWIDKLLRKFSGDHLHGKPECIARITTDSRIEINDRPLKNILNHENVKNAKIVALSTVGVYRKGKSFLLNYCLRFLYAHYKSINFPENPLTSHEGWMGEIDEALKGFSWRSGADRDTTGIIIWNDAFLYTDRYTGKDVAIIVIDTEGLFYRQNSVFDDSRIFALSTLISSTQIFNTLGLMQGDQLQYLNFALEFTKFPILNTQEMYKPLQSLFFLIRDWVHIENCIYGVEGGELYSNNFLEGQNHCITIYNSFDQLNCSLLPHPGKAVTGGKKKLKKYDGNWGEMDEDFKEELVKLIEQLLKPDKLILKKINGSELSGTEYLEYVQQYFKLFQSDELPPAQTIYESTVENQISILVDICFKNYKRMIQEEKALITNAELVPIFHERSKDKTLLMYKSFKKLGNCKHEEHFEKKLIHQIDNDYHDWSKQVLSSVHKTY